MQRFFDDLRLCDTVVAHNSRFDRTILRHCWGIDVPIDRWYDTMIQAMAHGLPGGLDKIGQIVEPSAGGGAPGSYMDAGKFREEMRTFLDSIGYVPPVPTGNKLIDELVDLTSQRRLDLIVKTNVSMARGYGQHVQSYSPELLDAFPCQELFRLGQRKEPRDWPTIWKDKGGTIYGGRMIAEKGDAIWTDISRFGNPYPPFDFGSGMWVKDVPRAVAVRLGVIRKSDQIKAKPTALKGKFVLGDSFSPEIAAQLRGALHDALAQEGD